MDMVTEGREDSECMIFNITYPLGQENLLNETFFKSLLYNIFSKLLNITRKIQVIQKILFTYL